MVTGPLELVTERLVVREFIEADWPALYAIESDPEVARFQDFEPRSEAEAQTYLRRTIAEARQRPRRTYDMAITLRESGQLIGRCGLHVTDREHREAMVWYTLLRSQWGHGFTPEALRALVGFGFAELNLHRVWADCDPANRASWRVLEKLGMHREGHLRENAWIKGEWVDSLIYAILDREWAAS